MLKEPLNWTEFFESEKQKNKFVKKWVDIMILQFPISHHFEIYSQLAQIDIHSDDRKKVHSIYKEVIDYMNGKGLIIRSRDNLMVYELTEKGKEAKIAGGYTKFLKSQKDWLKILPIVISTASLFAVIIFGVLNLIKNSNNENYKKLLIENKRLKSELLKQKK